MDSDTVWHFNYLFHSVISLWARAVELYVVGFFDGVNVSVIVICLFELALQWSGDPSGVHPASHPVAAETGSAPQNAQLDNKNMMNIYPFI